MREEELFFKTAERPARMRGRVLLSAAMACVFIALFAGNSIALERFPKPEFDTGHVVPKTTTPAPRPDRSEWLDVAVLFLSLSLASYFVLRRRRRREVFLLMLLCLSYFGLYRQGCVCSIGAIQNIALGLTDRSYAVPWTVVAFFALPLAFALFFGRTFCAAVCPLGAIQDVFIVRPRRLPAAIAYALGMVPFIYLAVAVLLAVTNTRFLICKYDPFVAFFRLEGAPGMLAFGVVFLAIGTVVGRPYCRFLCPYSVLLNWASLLAKWHVTITPDDCVNCRLCEESCPFDAILVPPPEKHLESRARGIRRLAILLPLVPVMILGVGWIGSVVAGPLARANRTLSTAERVVLEDTGVVGDQTLDSETFRNSGKLTGELFGEALEIRDRMRKGGWLAGGFVGLMFGVSLISLSLRRKREDYVPDKGACVSCARCFEYCPREHVRLSGNGYAAAASRAEDAATGSEEAEKADDDG